MIRNLLLILLISLANWNCRYTNNSKAQNTGVSENIILIAPTQIQANLFSFNNISCFGTADGAIDITISGGTQNTTPPFYNVSWSGPSFFSTNTDINYLVTSGTYTSVITDANNCNNGFII